MSKENNYAIAAACCLVAMMFAFQKACQPGAQAVWSALLGAFAIGAVNFIIAAARADR